MPQMSCDAAPKRPSANNNDTNHWKKSDLKHLWQVLKSTEI